MPAKPAISREEQDAFALRSHQRAHRGDRRRPLRRRDRAARRVADSVDGNGAPAIRRHFAWTKGRGATRRPRRSRSCGRRFTSTARSPPATRRRRATAPRRWWSSRTRPRAHARARRRSARSSRYATAGVEPERFGIGPVPAVRKALKLAGSRRSTNRSRRAERSLRRAGARVPAASCPSTRALNVNGGAIALGHPLGCTGAKLTATLAARDDSAAARATDW